MSTGREPFRIFISHKHDDHDAAAALAAVLTEVDEQIKCFVSGAHLVAGTDWNAEIRTQLLDSHLLLLLFTEPSKSWDWCLYEAGLFTSLGDEHSVVCLYRAGGAAPRPLKALQCVQVTVPLVQQFLRQLCLETWRVSRKWRLGGLRHKTNEDDFLAAATRVVALFPPPRIEAAPTPHLAHYPCHRVVLDLRGQPCAHAGIPDSAWVVEGEGATSTFTMSLFNLTRGLRHRTWHDLVQASGDPGGLWLAHLNQRYAAAVREELFSPALITPMPLIDAYTGQRRRSYRPVIYEIQRAPACDPSSAGPESLQPMQLTLVLDPVYETA
ncbi:MAG: TIR domain-containing protein [Aquabacterium sp.]|nr:TIR domain-containing protein [Aquabacterium sp.]